MSWSFEADFRDIPTAGSAPPRDAGVYCVRFQTTRQGKSSNNNPRAYFTLAVQDEGYRGTTIFDGCNLPLSSSDGDELGMSETERLEYNKRLLSWWRGILASIGVSEGQLSKAKKVKVSGAGLQGKTAYVEFTPAPPTGGFSSTRFVNKETYDLLLPERGKGNAAILDDEEISVEEKEEELPKKATKKKTTRRRTSRKTTARKRAASKKRAPELDFESEVEDNEDIDSSSGSVSDEDPLDALADL